MSTAPKLDIGLTEDELRIAEEAAAAARARAGDVDALLRQAEDDRDARRRAEEAEALRTTLASIDIARDATARRLEAHRSAGCRVRPCEECWVARCIGCGVDVSYDDLESDVRTAVRAAAPGELVEASCLVCRPSAARAHFLRRARESLPEHYRWARWDAMELHGRVLHGNGGAEIAQARMLVDEGRVTLAGLPKAGKTTLLACMFNEVLDRGMTLAAPAYAPMVRRAAGALWVTALELTHAKAQWPLGKGEPPLIVAAKAATVLVIDDVGAELSEPQRAGVKDVILHRFDDDQSTWISVGVASTVLADEYGGGFTRRIGSEATVVMVGPPPIDPRAKRAP